MRRFLVVVICAGVGSCGGGAIVKVLFVGGVVAGWSQFAVWLFVEVRFGRMWGWI